MKRSIFALAALVATLFASCSTDTTQDAISQIPETLTVSFDESVTRIQLQDGVMVWTGNDLVSVFYRSDANQCWRFLGNTGDEGGSLQCESAVGATAQINRIIGVYPYSENYRLNVQTLEVEAFMPSVQTYVEGSFGVGSSILVSLSDDDRLKFKNVCGWLKLQFVGTGSVERIVLYGNNGEQVAGRIKINPSDGSCVLASESGGNSDAVLTEVTLNCPTAVALDETTPTSFYIALPPQTFEGGLTARAVCTDGTQMTKSTLNSIVIERNHIVPMSETTYSATNVIYYTSSDGEVVEPEETDVFGADILSNTYENGVGAITFNGDVTSIGEDAFYYCSTLTSIVIPHTVTSIGEGAFRCCEALKSITIPDSVIEIGYGAFSTCRTLASVSIGKNVSAIENLTFSECFRLTSIVIPDSVTKIGGYAFDYCTRLAEVTLGKSVASIGDSAFSSCSALQNIVIPDSVTSIGAYAFSTCSKLESVTFGKSVKSIGVGAFADCAKLKEFNGGNVSADGRVVVIDGRVCAFAPADLTEYTIPDGVSVIGNSVFRNLKNISKITMPASVTTIENSAFALSRLTDLEIPDSVTTIGESAFSNNSLKNITVGSGVKSIGDDAFYGGNPTNVYIKDLAAWCQISFADNDANPFEKNTNIYVDGVLTKNLVLPQSVSAYAFYAANIESVESKDEVESIGDSAFYGCANLKSVDISKGITSVKDYAFFGCNALSSVTFSEKLTTIGMHTFESCRAITSVTLPSSVTSIGRDAFYNCTTLKEVCCLAATPPQSVEYYGRWTAFNNNAADRKIYVPFDSVDAYKSAFGWSTYASAIEPYNFTE